MEDPDIDILKHARNDEIIQKVMATLEEDYASDSPESLEAKFSAFAKEHSGTF